jgi:hypothetical protein
MKDDAVSTDSYLATVHSWIGGTLSVRMPGGEDGHEFLHRYDSAVTEVFDSGLPVCRGLLSWLCDSCLGLDPCAQRRPSPRSRPRPAKHRGDRARGLADELVSEVEDKYRLTRGLPLAPDAKACHASSY